MESPPDIRVKPPCSGDDALFVLKRLRDAGYVAYFAGGCVRDTLLGREPKDWDVATDAPPPRVRQLFSNTQAVGAAFGVILVRYNESQIEVATFRADGEYQDGRHPTGVRFTTAEEDAKRRDFSINGLFLDPLNDEVIDYVGGRADLAAHRIRAIGDPEARFAEDHLRMLRAVRFASRFSFEIDPATAAAIKRNSVRLRGISPERIADELRVTLTAKTRAVAWPILWDLGLASEIFRFVPVNAGFSPSIGNSIFLKLSPGNAISFGHALAAAVLDIKWPSSRDEDARRFLGKAEVQKIVRAMRQGLKISNDESEELANTLTNIAPLLADELPTLAAKKRFLAKPAAQYSSQLMDAMAGVGLVKSRIESLRADLTALLQTEFNPTPFVSGDDLTAAGLTPGPAFKEILESVYDAQLEGRVGSKDAAMDLALSTAGKSGK